MARKALGKGLDALLGGGSFNNQSRGGENSSSHPTAEHVNYAPEAYKSQSTPSKGEETSSSSFPPTSSSAGVLEIPLERIVPNEFQPRQEFREGAMRDLVQSIREKGVLQPIIVRPRRGAGPSEAVYELVAGERRWRASLEAGLKSIPALIKEMDEEGSLEIALIENIQRENLGPLEEAEAYEELLTRFGLTHDQIAGRVGKERTTITNALRLLKLPDEIRVELKAGRISAGHARAILALANPADQLRLLRDILKDGLSVRQAERWVLSKEGLASSSKKKGRVQDPNIRVLEDELMRLWGVPFHVVKRKRGARIVIDAKNTDEFQRLMELFKRAVTGSRPASSNGPLGPSSLGMK